MQKNTCTCLYFLLRKVNVIHNYKKMRHLNFTLIPALGLIPWTKKQVDNVIMPTDSIKKLSRLLNLSLSLADLLTMMLLKKNLTDSFPKFYNNIL